MEESIPLPPTAQVVADVIGREPTLALAKRAKYRAMYVPYRCRDNHWITRAIGRAHADRLSKEFGGLLLPLAKCHAVILAERDRSIRAAFRAGKTVEWLAQEHELSERAIFLILDPARAERQRQATRRLRARPDYQRPDRK
jgi:hypothetical protein